MVGRTLSFAPDPTRVGPDAEVVLRVSGIAAGPVRSASFDIRRGEIVCLAGLLGSGRSEVCEAIFGCRQLEQGGMTLLGDAYAPEDPASAMQAGVSMLPEDRKEAGLFLNFSIADNVVAANLTAYSRNGLLNRKAINGRRSLRLTACVLLRPTSDGWCRVCRAVTNRRSC